jgi:coenzyme F420-reducing hydrogenase delta subunit
LKTKDIKIAFPDYQGDQTVEACSEFIKQKFLAKNKHDPNRVQCTFTSATNSDMVKDSIEMVKNTLSKQRPSKETK